MDRLMIAEVGARFSLGDTRGSREASSLSFALILAKDVIRFVRNICAIEILSVLASRGRVNFRDYHDGRLYNVFFSIFVTKQIYGIELIIEWLRRMIMRISGYIDAATKFTKSDTQSLALHLIWRVWFWANFHRFFFVFLFHHFMW